MPTTDDIIVQLRRLIATRLDVNLKEADISADVSLMEDGLRLDSLAIVELITLIEDTFHIQFGEDDLTMDTFASLRTLAEVIERHPR